jgi:hemoglobin
MIRSIVMIATLAFAIACGGKGKGAEAPKPLYDRLGGKDAIVSVVDEFVANVGADPVIKGRFEHADVNNLKKQLVDQICAATGGPCTYTGKDMKLAHTGMQITDAEFTALVNDLKKSLDKHKVEAKEQEELLGALGKMKPEIVGQ